GEALGVPMEGAAGGSERMASLRGSPLRVGRQLLRGWVRRLCRRLLLSACVDATTNRRPQDIPLRRGGHDGPVRGVAAILMSREEDDARVLRWWLRLRGSS